MSAVCGIAIAVVGGLYELTRPLVWRHRYVPDRLRQYMDGTPENDGVAQKPRRGGKGKVNVDVTCPGATLALGLMYLKTGNRAIAARLAIPRTKFHLDFIRPDCLLLRALCYNLVLWDTIEPTVDWVTSQLPPIVEQQMRAVTDDDVDSDLFRNAYVNICAGNCFAIGLRFAGTQDGSAIQTLFHYAKELRATQPLFSQTGRSILEGCVNMTVVSLALVNAGTGDLGTLRLIRSMHKRIGQEVSSGLAQLPAHNGVWPSGSVVCMLTHTTSSHHYAHPPYRHRTARTWRSTWLSVFCFSGEDQARSTPHRTDRSLR